MTKGISLDLAQQTVEVVNDCLQEGFPWDEHHRGVKTARAEAARRLGIQRPSLYGRLEQAENRYGLKPDLTLGPQKATPFSFDPLPHDGEPDAETLIGHLKVRHAERKAHHDAAQLQTVRINIDGPIGLVFFGDPHIDDPGCAWGDLERDVALCRDTPGILAVNVGDSRNNWVGNLMRLYAKQEVTSKQGIVLLEWLLTQIPWLLTVGGNHDKWNAEGGDVAEVIHRMHALPGLYENDGARLRLVLPNGAECFVHVRHDFPGKSQFNAAHALVRETLFGYRDHILACGHRHQSGYIPIWHNDPVRLCHGFRCGSYKDHDDYAKTKHFRLENWARSMGVVIDPASADDPVHFTRRCYSVEEVVDSLTWRRSRWELGKAA